MNRISRRAEAVSPFRVMQLMVAAQQLEAEGRDIVHMEVGEPDFDTPAAILAAAQQAIANGNTRYTQAKGLPALRKAIVDYYLERFDVSVDERRILVTPGASGALQLVFAALLDSGQTLGVTDPGYPANTNIARALGIEVVPLTVTADQDFWPTAQQIQSARLNALLLNTPANPTGSVLSKLACDDLIEACRSAGTSLILDEIYQGLVFDQSSFTALELGDDTWVVNSFSKYFGMTGWRLGWLVAPDSCVDAAERLAQNMFIASNTISQFAALAALTAEIRPELDRRRDALQQRRDYLAAELDDMGFQVLGNPAGAFYLFADASAFTEDAEPFVHDMLHKAGVVATPGIDFGSNNTQACVRFSYTTSMDRLVEGVRRMREYLV